MQETVSVIIPVYNHARVLPRALESIARQIVAPQEIIIVNDGSTDAFETLAPVLEERYKAKIIHQANSGAAAARNRGFKEATGNFIIFWDADTVARPDFLQKLLEALKNNPTASFAYSQFRFGWKKMSSQKFDVKALKKINYIDTTTLVRCSALAEVAGPFDESLKRFQDWDLWLRLADKNKIGVFVPEVLFKKYVLRRVGISAWLPAFFYRLPWKIPSVKAYEAAREIIIKKHGLTEPTAR